MRLLGWTVVQFDWFLYKKRTGPRRETPEMGMCREKTMWDKKEKVSWGGGLKRDQPCQNSRILDFQLLELWEICGLNQPVLAEFIVAVWAKGYNPTVLPWVTFTWVQNRGRSSCHFAIHHRADVTSGVFRVPPAKKCWAGNQQEVLGTQRGTMAWPCLLC